MDKDQKVEQLERQLVEAQETNERLIKEARFLQALNSTLNMNLNIAEAGLKQAQLYVDQLHDQMRLLHEQYTANIRKAHTDSLGFPRGEPKGPEWDSN